MSDRRVLKPLVRRLSVPRLQGSELLVLMLCLFTIGMIVRGEINRHTTNNNITRIDYCVELPDEKQDSCRDNLRDLAIDPEGFINRFAKNQKIIIRQRTRTVVRNVPIRGPRGERGATGARGRPGTDGRNGVSVNFERVVQEVMRRLGPQPSPQQIVQEVLRQLPPQPDQEVIIQEVLRRILALIPGSP